jgi:Protein of unknown function (DUF3025)
MDGVAPALHTLRDLDAFPAVRDLDARLGALLPPREGGRYRLVEDRSVRPRKAPPKPVSERYDVVIDARGEIPTRPDNWHDLFNALVWASFPRAKSRLSARQRRLHEDRARRGDDTHARTRAQDALALLDEGGVLSLCAPGDLDTLTRALSDRSLAEIVREGRARALLFGHAALEHLVHGDGVRAVVIPLAVDDPHGPLAVVRARTDLALAAALDDDRAFAGPPPWPAAPVGLTGV